MKPDPKSKSSHRSRFKNKALLRYGAHSLFGLALCMPSSAVAQSLTQATLPTESQAAFRNPFKGFRVGADSWTKSPAPTTIVHHYIPWSDIENSEADTEQKIRDYCNQRWASYAANNIKVVPRVYLDWNWENGNSFPADLKTGAYANVPEEQLWTHPQLRARVTRMIERLGRVWDNDPRVAWVQTGIIGWWGEQEQPAPGHADAVDANGVKWSTLMGNAYTSAFKNKQLLVRNREQWLNYNMGVYWDSFAHPNQQWVNNSIRTYNYNATSTYKNSIIEGETAYDWGDFPATYGRSPSLTFANMNSISNGGTYTGNQSYLNFNYVPNTGANYTDKMIGVIRDLHCSGLGWISSYTLDANELSKYNTTPAAVKLNADRVHNAFGYKYVVTQFACTRNPSPGANLQLNFSVENRGSANIPESWPVALVLIDPATKLIRWKGTLDGINPRSWLPGNQYNFTTKTYTNPPSGGSQISASVQLPPNLPVGNYLVGLSILDPASGHPGVFFASDRFLKESQTQPLCQIRVGTGTLPEFNLAATMPVDSLVNDDQRSFNMPLSRTGWTATASQSNWDAPKAIDGNASSRWSTGAIQNNTGNQWIKVNLGAVQSFDRISLNTLGSVNDEARSYEVYVSDNDTNWTRVATSTDRGSLTFVSFPAQNKQWIRINQIGTTTFNWWSIHELNLFAPTPAPRFTGSGSGSDLNSAFDGNSATRWSSNDWQKPGQYIEVDMRSNRSFTRVILDSTQSPNDFPRAYTVEVSSNKITWSQIASGPGANVTTSGVTTITVSPQITRYIRIKQTGTTTSAYWSINEFRVQ